MILRRYLAALAAAIALSVPVLGFAQLANLGGIILPSAARTTTPVNSADQNNPGWRGAHLIINVTAFTAGTYTAHVQGKDPISGNYYDICVGTAIGSVSTNILKVYPGINVTANVACSDILPKTWRVQMIGATGQSMTFSVGVLLQE